MLLTFREGVRYTLFDLVRMSDELESIFGRPVDVLDRQAVEQSQNYLRRDTILSSAKVIYASDTALLLDMVLALRKISEDES